MLEQRSRDIAVIGISFRLPGADTLEKLEILLNKGQKAITRFTPSELDEFRVPVLLSEGHQYFPLTGHIDNADKFDAEFFRFTNTEACVMDPQYRLLFECSYEALESAALIPVIDKGVICVGAFVTSGMALYSSRGMNSYYHHHVKDSLEITNKLDPLQIMFLNDKDWLSTQLSYRLKLTGPSINIQTACSSSLVAMHYALQSLRNGECDAALVGASAIHTPLKSGYLYTEGSIFSATGACNPFSESADGTIGGNGVIAIVLCPLEKAIENNQHIYGIIKGSAINNDGARKVSFTAPSVDGQRENIKNALEDANIKVTDIRYVEAHGTATKLGDPIEVAAFSQAFESFTNEKQFCHIGSIKSNIGHLDTAAGLASVVKCLSLFKNKTIPPIAGYSQPNPYIDFIRSPFKINTHPIEFERINGNRLAMIASLGAGGTNAHLVLQDWDENIENTAYFNPNISYLLPISAKSAEALMDYARKYIEFLNITNESLADICYTASVYRAHYKFRLCVAGKNKNELITVLKNYINNALGLNSDVNSCSVAKSYINGKDINWENYWIEEKRRKVIIPTYPFQRKRFWIDEARTRKLNRVNNHTYYQKWIKYHFHPESISTHANKNAKYLIISDELDKNCARLISQFQLNYGNIQTLPCDQLNDPEKFEYLLNEVMKNENDSSWRIIYFPLVNKNAIALLSRTLSLLKIIQLRADRQKLSFTVITSGSQYVNNLDTEIEPTSASLWSFIQSAMLEIYQFEIYLYDVGLHNNADSFNNILQDIKETHEVKKIVYRQSERYIAKIASITGQRNEVSPYQTNESGLIIGAFGGIGKLLIQHLIKRRCKHLILIGRSNPEKNYINELLTNKDIKIDILIEDIKNVKVVIKSLRVSTQSCNFKEVYHLAGAISDKTITNMDANDIASVLQPKIKGVALIQKLINDFNPKCIILFSSIASIYGAAGQSNYAAANAFLNAFAISQQLQGRSVYSLCFGPWKNVGMTAKIKNLYQNMSSIKPLLDADYLHSLDHTLSSSTHVAIIANLDVEKTAIKQNDQPKIKNISLHEVKSWLKSSLAELLGSQLGDIEDNITFNDLNVDSLTMLMYVQSLDKKFNLSLPISAFYNHPTIEKISAVIYEKLAKVKNELNGSYTRISHSDQLNVLKNKIAIVGMGCRFPNKINSPDAFWTSLTEGEVPIVSIPANRYSLLNSFKENPRIYAEINESKAAFLDDIYSFDPIFFGLTPKETYDLDPQYRLLLECTWESLENAAIPLKTAQDCRTGLYMGIGTDDFTHLALQEGKFSKINNYTITGSNRGIGVGRISYLLGLRGPSLAIDTTCSSSLVATHYAIQGLLTHEVDLAFAGGVNLILSPFNIIGRKHLGIVSNKNICKVFDNDADGFVQGEGAGVVLLKRLEDAIRDNDHIYAVIVGSAVNQNGGGNGLQAPNGLAQKQLLADTLIKSKLSATDVDFIEAHGTGTKLGDPIEVEAIARVYGVNRPKDRPILIGSAKASYGHLEPAAGILSLMKTALCLKHKMLIKQQHYENSNKHIDWKENNVKVVTENCAWPQSDRLARAAVSSFGINGTNAHLIIEEYQSSKNQLLGDNSAESTLPISAKTEDALQTYVQNYINYLKTTNESLGNICYTASVGRDFYKYNLCVTGIDKNSIIIQLKNYLKDKSSLNKKNGINQLKYFDKSKYKKIILPVHPYIKKEYISNEVNDMSLKNMSTPCQSGRQLLSSIINKLKESIMELTDLSFEQCDESATLISLGIDSYIMIALVQRIKEIWDVNIPIRELFESHNKIAKIADYILRNATVETDQANFSKTAQNNAVKLSGSHYISAESSPAATNISEIPKFSVETFSLPASNISNDSYVSELSQQEKVYLHNFIKKYNDKTVSSKRMAKEARSFLCNNRKSSSGFRLETKELNYPIVAVRSYGSKIVDIDNNTYIDLSMGFGANLFGHNPEFIKSALLQQIEKGYQLGPEAEKAAACAKLIAEFSKQDKILFTNSGTEAVMTAIRIARAYRKKTKIVVFQDSYHGHFDNTLVSVSLSGETIPDPMCIGIPRSMVDDIILLPYDKNHSLDEILKQKDNIAAVLVEPVQNRRPDLHPKEFLKKLRAITTQNNISLIFDEILVGFRVASGGAQHWFDIDADLVTYGKIVGGGLPIGVIAGKREHMDMVDGGMWNYGDNSEPFSNTTYTAGTFCKHPLVMAASYATLIQIKQQGSELYRILNHRCDELFKIINKIFSEYSVPLKIYNFGSFFRFAQSDNLSFLYQPLELDIFFYHLIEKGVYVWESKTCFISTEHSNDDMDKIINAILDTVLEMKNAGFWGGAVTSISSPLKTSVTASSNLENEVSTIIDGKFIAAKSQSTKIDFSLYFFGDYKDYESNSPYKLIMEAAKYADKQGFKAIWLPERHFNSFGGFSPNPAVISSALARETHDICLRASIVMPLQHPARIVEEWSVVQHLSQSKQVGLALAPGWHTNDFILNPDAWETRKELLYKNILITQKLWSGKQYTFLGPNNIPTPTETFPKPEHCNLPLWIASIDNREVFAKAGELGIGIITNLLGQDLNELKDNIIVYKNSRKKQGLHPDAGHIVVLVHTLVCADKNQAIELARKPFCDYLSSSVGLFQKMAQLHNLAINFDELTRDDRNYIINHAYERLSKGHSLIGDVDSCYEIVNELANIGVSEVACFIDFGVRANDVLDNLVFINDLKNKFLYSTLTPNKKIEHPAKILPLMKNQMQMLTVEYLDTGAKNINNLTMAFTLEGEIDTEIMKKAYQSLIDHHASLRVTIDEEKRIQIFHKYLSANLELIDLTSLNEITKQNNIQVFFEDDTNHLCNLAIATHRIILMLTHERKSILIINIHHIISDGISLEILLNDITHFYNLHHAGIKKNLAQNLCLQYDEFVKAKLASKDKLFDQENYWKKIIASGLTNFEFPTDFNRPAIKTYYGQKIDANIDIALQQSLQNLSSKHEITNFTIMLSAYAILLSRLTKQNSVVIGMAFSGRTLPRSEKTIGYFSNMYPLQFDINLEITVKEILQITHRKILDTLENQDYSASEIIEKTRKTFDLSRAALFNVAFNWDNIVVPEFNGIKATHNNLAKRYVRNDLMLNIIKINGNLIASIEYNSDLYKPITVNKVLQDYLYLLKKITENVDLIIGVVPFNSTIHQSTSINETSLPTEAATASIDLWNNTKRNFPMHSCVHIVFENIVSKYPNKIAIKFAGDELSYGQLNEFSNQIAHRLKNSNKNEEIIAICAPRSFKLIAGILGILKSGAAYLPCDPTLPNARLNYMIKNADARRIVITNSVKHLFFNFDGEIINLDDKELRSLPTSNLNFQTSSDATAYVMYTSGSTGEPKGVARAHRSIMNRMTWMWEGAGLSTNDICALQASISVIDSGWEIFGALLTGATLVMYDELHSKNADELLKQCVSNNVTRLTIVPSLLKELLSPNLANKNLFDSLSINYWQVTGEPIDIRYIEELFQLTKNRSRITECYGTTEATSSLFKEYYYYNSIVTNKTVQSFNTEIYILDSSLNKVSIGAVGDLFVGGEVLAKGYINNPSLTDNKFIPNPFINSNKVISPRIYHTGDLARYLPDGSVQILGRKDNQIKIRGYRVELGEIESVLQRVKQVKDSVVIVNQENEAQKKLVAYITTNNLNTNENELIQQLREMCRNNLPDYMLPSQIIILEKIPLTESGKIDKKQLPQSLGREGQAQFEAPIGEVENEIAAIWSSLLKIKQIGRNDNFFELGGDSLLLIQFISKVIKEFKTAFTMAEIYVKQTIREVAECITTKSVLLKNDKDKLVSNISSDNKKISPEQTLITGDVPLLPNRFSYFLARLRNHESWYVTSPILETVNTLDQNRFKNAISLLITHHDGLRLKISNTQNWAQKIVKPDEMNVFEYIKYNQKSDSGFKTFVELNLYKLRNKILFSGELFKILYIENNQTQSGIIYILSHHLLLDAFSARIVIYDLFTLYLQLAETSQPVLPLKTTSLKDYSEILLAYLDKTKNEEYAYWKNQPWLEVKPVPIDYPENAAFNIEGESLNIIKEISDSDIVEFMKKFQGDTKKSFNNLLLHAIAQAYKTCFGHPILYLGLVFHGREVFIESMDISRTVGWFGEVVPIMINADDTLEKSLENINTQIRRVNKRGKTFNYLKYICKDKKIKKGMSTIPVPQISLNIIPTSIEKRDYSNVVKSTLNFSTPILHKASTERVYLISGGAYFSNNKFNISWDFSQKIFDKEAITKFTEVTMNFFIQLLNKIKNDQNIDIKFTEHCG